MLVYLYLKTDVQEQGKQEGRLDTKNQAQAGNSEKGAASIMVAMVGLWNPSQKDATGDDWIKAVKVALDNYRSVEPVSERRHGRRLDQGC